jgi:glycosyltransferase involved in cell wall biosynthesis
LTLHFLLSFLDTAMPRLLVFSHLRWNFVYQRPQHLLSRLARAFPVVFIEEPLFDERPAHLERLAGCPGVDVLRPHTPVRASGFHDDQLASLKALVDDYLVEERIDDYAVWFYTPMALPLLNGLSPQVVVYDCMDELSAFKGAPRQMRQRETGLMKRADVVLTGGPRLFEAKRHLARNVLCLPSAVDAAHYDRARAIADEAAMQRAAALQEHVARPRLGFFGVIDERIDLDLLARLADAQPAWQIVMVGPVVKIDPASLPQRPNLHWLGQQPYELLPQLVADWDLCLMPFALNESTAFISPTKTLEYMAAGKPVVSTPIHDVKAMFGDIVAIADCADSFVAACRAALDESRTLSRERQERMLLCVARHSWEQAAATARDAIETALAEPRDPSRPGFEIDEEDSYAATA